MDRIATTSYRFEDYCLDTSRRLLTRAGEPVALTPKAFDTLLALIKRAERAVGKDELLAEVWPDSFVEEATLAQNIFTLRKILGKTKNNQSYIETVPKFGYRFAATVTETELHTVEQLTRTLSVEPQTLISTAENNGSGLQFQFESPIRVSETERSQLAQLESSRTRTKFIKELPRPRGNLRTLAVVLVGLVTIATMFVGVKRLRRAVVPADPSKALHFSRLTNNGRVDRAAVSADGRFVAYVQNDELAQSLWVRQVGSGTSIEIVRSIEIRYVRIMFSPDASSVYAVIAGGKPELELYRVPVLGGQWQKVLTDIDSNISFSPDAQRFAFVDSDPQTGSSDLMSSNLDGSEILKLTTLRPAGEVIGGGIVSSGIVGDGPAWSPDGKVIVFGFRTGTPNRPNNTLMAVRLDNGERQQLTTHTWDSIGQISWLSDGTALLLNGWDESASSVSSQIWQVSYPGGETHQITHDLNTYKGLSLAANTKSLLTVVSERIANFWVAPTWNAQRAKQITSGLGDKRGEKLGLCWTADGRLVYGSTAGNNVDVWIMNADGTNQKQLTSDPHIDMKPTVPVTGNSVVFVSRRSGSPELWIMSLEGNEPRRLTNHQNGTYPAVTPDGKWVAYTVIDENGVSLWKVATEGGPPVALTDKLCVKVSISPDGRLAACYYQETLVTTASLAILPLTGGAPIKTFDLHPGTSVEGGLSWAADGRSIIYLETTANVSNFLSQSLSGGPPRRLTNFTSGQIFRFALAPDGQQVAFERGYDVTDAVLITLP